MKTQMIREHFLNYFQSKGHTKIASSSLVPTNDPTLLFTNAGMVQFKDVFLGLDKRSYSRAVTIQRCVRASGKHNDLEQVGYTARHHTFFEMLGNFSFGDYFKREAIFFAWEFLTGILKLSPGKLWVTVFEKDDEAANIWLNEIKIDPKRFSRCGEKDNFWAMGDTGPCGPCSEIFYDHGADISGGPPGSEEEGDRYTEIWNLVFMQFNRDEQGVLTPLSKPCVDTGMGLERLAAVMQGVHDNYDTDTFQYLLKAIHRIVGDTDPLLASPPLRIAARVVADHIRCCSFLVADGVLPSNEGRGYVLRRIMRRAIRYGKKMAAKPEKPFFYKLVKPLIEIMGEAYPELIREQKRIEQVLLKEEEQFEKTLQQGLKILDDSISKITSKILPGAMAFKLYDTYGFPLDLTTLIAKERGFSVDEKGFDLEMEKQRKLSQGANRFQSSAQNRFAGDSYSQFCGYDSLQQEGVVLALLNRKTLEAVDALNEGDEGCVILDRTPFYPEGGGQVGDKGLLKSPDGLFEVCDTKKMNQSIVHIGKIVQGTWKVPSSAVAVVDSDYRQAIQLNHSTTHLLHHALRKVLGDHVAQKGSLVEAEKLRFDFSHGKPLSEKEIREVENLVNQSIRSNFKIMTDTLSFEEATSRGAIALFEEKYGERVRVVSMGDLSIELCGGTHAPSTGHIGLFKIISEEGIASGVRRIEAVTGKQAFSYIQQKLDVLREASMLMKASESDLIEKLTSHNALLHHHTEVIAALKKEKAKARARELESQAEILKDIHFVIQQVESVDLQTLREMVDQLKNQLPNAIILLATIETDAIHLVAGVSKSCLNRFHAGELVKMAAEKVGGKGGGRPDIAQGGGKFISELPNAIIFIKEWTKQKI